MLFPASSSRRHGWCCGTAFSGPKDYGSPTLDEVLAISTASPNRTQHMHRPSSQTGILVCALLLLPLGSWMGVQAYRPFAYAAALRAQNDAKEREILQLNLQNQRTEREIRALDTRDGVIRAARPLGWVLPGESKLRLPKP